jgi:16S rRNA (guanine966-N2)-methyltransferase
MAGNEVRIIGGNWKGRKLRFPAVAGLRPTLGRARESVFNWLASEIHDASCLDLFAGSGALGMEALSRGARQVTFVERNRLVAKALRDNIALLHASNADVFSMPAKRFLQHTQARWDIIFLDPPFSSSDFAQALDLIKQQDLLRPNGLLYFERPRKEALTDDGHWQLCKTSRVGDAQFGLLGQTTRDHTLSL